MLIAEYDYDMDIEVQREEAFTEGKEKERELLNQLTRLLIAEKRYEDLDRAAEDIDYQDKLLHEYNLVQFFAVQYYALQEKQKSN